MTQASSQEHRMVAGSGSGSAVQSSKRPARSVRRQPLVAAAAILSAASMLTFGVWAYFWPRSFSDFVDYAPYNTHLIHDAGAFQIGIGAIVLLALVWSDGLLIALTGFAVASGLHTISHYTDRHIGGHDSDVPTLGIFTLIALIGIYARIHGRKS